VTGGNVSLYNQSPAGAIDPTPTVGMVGLIADEKHVTSSHFKAAGDAILLLGDDSLETPHLGASHYLKVLHRVKSGPVPRLDFARELALQECVRALIKSRLVRSAHDCNEGGLAVALAECCISNPDEQLGASVELHGRELSAPAIALFGEAQSRLIISVAASNASAVLALCEWRGVPAQRLGTVGGRDLTITTAGETFVWPLASLHSAWYSAIASAMEG
jgi:phosphoribosylformylglycinamidine synthase